MIKFFRIIRQKIIYEGNLAVRKSGLKSYLIYSIGEILLVVIGILIALQVNNWNNENANKDKEVNILSEMVRNLEVNVNQFSEEIEKQDSIIRNINVVMNQIKNNTPYHDSLGTKYASIAWTEEFNYANSAFETLKTIGFDLISSDSLREHIIDLFNVRYERIFDVINKVSTAEYSGLVTLYFRHIEFNEQGEGMVNNLPGLNGDKEFTNMLSSRRVWKMDLIKTYKELIEESQQLSKKIDRELKRNN